MKKRLAGYRDALAEYELPFREELVFEGTLTTKTASRLPKGSWTRDSLPQRW